MHHWTKRLFAVAAPLLLTGCLWGPGKFASNLTLNRNGTFVLDYRGEIVMQLPPDAQGEPWKDDMARCYDGVDGSKSPQGVITEPGEEPKQRPCNKAEIEAQKTQHAEKTAAKRKESEEMAKAFGIPGLDDESNRAFASKLLKYAGWRSVRYRGNGVFDVDYHFEGRATQDFIFPELPDNDVIIPFIAIRRRADGAVLVTAPAMTGKAGPIGARAGAAAADAMKGGPVSRAEGRLTIVTDGEILTNNSEDGAAPHPVGRQLRWDVGPASTRIPETLIRLQ